MLKIPHLTGPRSVLVTLPLDGPTPPVLRTAEGQPAWFVKMVGDRAAYSFRTFNSGEVLSLVPWGQDINLSLIKFSPHPNFAPEDLLPKLDINGSVLTLTATMNILDTPAVQQFRMTYETNAAYGKTAEQSQTVAALTVTLYVNSPVAYVDGWIARRGTQASPSEKVSVALVPSDHLLQINRTSYFPKDDQPQGDNPMKLVLDLYCTRAIRWTITAPPREGDHNDDAQEIASAREHPWPVVAVDPSLPLLSGPSTKERTYDHVHLPPGRMYTPANDPDQPGDQSNLGVQASVALWRESDPATALLKSVDIGWAPRPSFFLTAHGVRPATEDEMEHVLVGDRRIRKVGPLLYPPGEAPQFTSGLVQRAIDEQHQMDAPLHTAMLISCDPVASELVLSNRIVDSATTRASHGWVNDAPRGDGRWAESLTRSAALVGAGNSLAAITNRAESIIREADAFASKHGFPANAALRPWKYHHAEEANQIAVYEYAQAAHGFLLAYRFYGNELFKKVALMGAAISVAYTWMESGNWFAPYRCSLLSDAGIPTMTQLEGSAIAARTHATPIIPIEPGNSGWIYWNAPGIFTAVELMEHENPLRVRAEEVLQWLRGTQPVNLIAADYIL
jgi:hypothetical protein